MIRLRHTAALAAAALLLAACRSDDRAAEIASTRPFAEAFERVASVTLEQSDSLPIVAPMKPGILRGDGRIAVPDYSEGNVHLFAADGRRLRTLGRKGHGPGEFIAPVSAAWDDRGYLHVLDIQRSIISVFDSAGSHVREVNLAKVGTAMDLAPLPDRGYLVLGSESPTELLTRIDSAGNPVRAYLSIARFKPAGTSNAAIWERSLMPQMRVDGQTAFVALSAADSLWTVDLASGRTASSPLRPATYVTPRDPKPSETDGPPFQEWLQAADRVRGLAAGGSRAFASFAHGPYDRPDVTLLVRAPDGRVDAYTDAKVVQEVVQGRLVIAVFSDTTLAFEYWRPRP